MDKKINLEVYRKEGKTILKFSVDENIENIYKKQRYEIRESTNWEGLKFYYMPNIVDSQEYRNLCRNHSLFDDYGSSITKDGIFNIAWLRTVGGHGEIIIPNDVTFDRVSKFIQDTISFLKIYFEMYFREFRIRGELKLEI